MDCLKFTNWLVNRDINDVSEADKALKHTLTCQDCKAKYQFDEQVDKLLFKAMGAVEMPDSLRGKVDLSLDRISDEQSKSRFLLPGVVSAVIAAMFIVVFSFVITPSNPSIDQMGKYVVYDHSYHGDEILAIDDPTEVSSLTNTAIDYHQIKKHLNADYTFVGGRICPLGDCPAIHLVYRKNGERVSLYLIDTQDIDFSIAPGKNYKMSYGSQKVNFWQEGNFVFAMIG